MPSHPVACLTFRSGFEVYAGVENALGFQEGRPILDSADPNGKYFGTSVVWGPVAGRMASAGLRWEL